MDRLLGKIKRVFLPKGFGFIRRDDGQDYFLHMDDLDIGTTWDETTIAVNKKVEFTPLLDQSKGNGRRTKKVTVLPAPGDVA